MVSTQVETNWYVLTGGPGSGKTTTIELIAAKGYKTTIEHARHYIQTQMQKGKTADEVRRNQEEFQMGVLDMQIEQERLLSPQETVFLDRALPDALAYFHFLNLPVNKKLIEANKIFRYKRIFILDLLPLIQDYARKEDERSQIKIHELIIKVYSELDCPITYVPVLSPEERVQYILSSIP
jgi:predicted ATPase